MVEAIKGDTSITGSVDRSLDPVKNAGVAYNEQAGNDAYHEKKIDLLIKTAISKFEAEIAEFAEGTISDSVSTDENTHLTTITISVVVPSRYNAGIAKPLGGLAQSYIINMSLFGWWNSIKPDLAKGFATMAADALSYVRKCFAKAAPTAPTDTYSDITGTVTNI